MAKKKREDEIRPGKLSQLLQAAERGENLHSANLDEPKPGPQRPGLITDGLPDLLTQRRTQDQPIRVVWSKDMDVAAAAGKARKDPLFESKSAAKKDRGSDQTYRYINDIDGFRQKDQLRSSMSGTASPHRRYDSISEEERKLYNYLYETQGKAYAERYLNMLADELALRTAKGSTPKSVAGKLVTAFPAGVEQFYTGIKQNFQKDAVPLGMAEALGMTAREELASAGPQALGSSAGQAAYDAILNASNQVVPFLLSIGTGSDKLGSAVQGLSAGGNATREKLYEGMSQAQARVYGAGIGAMEAVLGNTLGGIANLSSGLLKKSVGKAAGKLAPGMVEKFIGVDKALRRFALNYAADIASEGLEEGIQEVLAPIWESIVTGKEMDPVSAEQVAYAALQGALGAGIFNSVNAAGRAAYQRAADSAVGKQIKQTSQEYSLIQEGLTAQADSDVNRLAKQLADQADKSKEAKVSNAKLGKLARTMAQAQPQSPAEVPASAEAVRPKSATQEAVEQAQAQNPSVKVMSPTAQVYTDQGISARDADKAADVMDRVLAGDTTLTESQKRKLNLNLPAYRTAFTQLTGVEVTNPGNRRAWLADVDTAISNAATAQTAAAAEARAAAESEVAAEVEQGARAMAEGPGTAQEAPGIPLEQFPNPARTMAQEGQEAAADPTEAPIAETAAQLKALADQVEQRGAAEAAAGDGATVKLTNGESIGRAEFTQRFQAAHPDASPAEVRRAWSEAERTTKAGGAYLSAMLQTQEGPASGMPSAPGEAASGGTAKASGKKRSPFLPKGRRSSVVGQADAQTEGPGKRKGVIPSKAEVKAKALDTRSLPGKSANDTIGTTRYSLKEDRGNGGAREETRAAFLRRATGEGLAVYEGEQISYGYRPVQGESAGENARQVQKEVKSLGIDADIIDGPILWNYNGITSAREVPQAVTADGSHIFISNSASLSPRNMAGHEAFHLWKNSAGRDVYIETVEDNLIFTNPDFLNYQRAIAEAYLGGEADIADDAQVKKLREELFAYISGDIHEGVNDEFMRPMFRDFDAVKAAWNSLVRENVGETRFSVKPSSEVSTETETREQSRRREQEWTVRRTNAILKKSGSKLTVELDYDGLDNNEPGFYDRDANAIHLNGNILTTQRALVHTLGHEFVHTGSDTARVKLVEDILKASYGTDEAGQAALEQDIKATRERYIDFYTQQKDLSNEEAAKLCDDTFIREEVAADAMREILLNTGGLYRMARENTGLLRSFRRKATDMLMQLSVKDEGGDTLEQYKALRGIVDRLDEAIRVAGAEDRGQEKVAAAREAAEADGETRAEKTAAGEGDGTKRHDLTDRITPGMSEEARYERLKDREITVPHYNAEKMASIEEGGYEALENAGRDSAFKILRKIGEQFGVFKDYHNTDMELDFGFSRRGLQESINKQGREFQNYAKMMSVFDDVVENAVGIEAHENRYKTRGDQVKETFVFASAFQTDTGVIPVLLEVRTFTDDTKSGLYVAVSLQEIERSRVIAYNAAPASGPWSSYTLPASETRVPDASDSVKGGGEHQLKGLQEIERSRIVAYNTTDVSDGSPYTLPASETRVPDASESVKGGGEHQLKGPQETERSRIVVYNTTDVSDGSPYTLPASNLKLADIFANVKPEDGRLLKYLPDGFLNTEQRAAKRKALQEQKEYVDRKNAGKQKPKGKRNSVEPLTQDETTKALLDGGAVAVDLSDPSRRYSIRSMNFDIADGKMFRDMKKTLGMGDEEIGELKRNLEELVNYMTPHRDILDMNETVSREGRSFSPYKPNSDPLYKISLDFSTLCSKRLMTQYVIENLQLRENRPLSAEEQLAVRDLLIEYRSQDKALQVACAMCYVEAARLKSPNQINAWLADPAPYLTKYFALKDKTYAAEVKEKGEEFKESRGYARNATKAQMEPSDVRELNELNDQLRKAYKPSEREQAIIDKALTLPNSTYLTSGNLASLRDSDPEIYDAYTSFIRNATRSKSLEPDVPYYYGDSRRKTGGNKAVGNKFIEAVNAENGMRASSWSDWRIQHMLDWITAVVDLGVRKSAMHAYTKFPTEVRVLGKTGIMFNLSGVLQGQTGLKEDGTLDFSPTESIDYEEALKLREEFPETAGMQCIGVSDESIRVLMESPQIDYIIPYHVSGMNATLRRMCDIYGWVDYTTTQNAQHDPKADKRQAADPEHWQKEPVFSEFFVGYDTGLSGVEAMRESSERYVQMCRNRGLIPKFEKFYEMDPDNYWKLLIDRKMVNQKTGELIQQKPVRPIFDFSKDGPIYKAIDAEVENYDPSRQQNALDYVTKHWDELPDRIAELKKNGTVDKALKGAKKMGEKLDALANETTAALPKGVEAVKGKRNSVVDPTADILREASPRDAEEIREISDARVRYSVREEEPPKKTGIAYKVFFAKDGNLYPPMVANPDGASTPIGVWLNADIGLPAEASKTGRPQVQAGGKGTSTGKSKLAFRPGWHLGDLPHATQFARKNPETGKKDLFPAAFVWAECEYAMDHDYQEEAMSYGYTENGKFRHSYAGLPKLPADGYYRYRTNPNPDTVPWVITGAMKVNRILTDEETDSILQKAGVTPLLREGGPMTAEKLEALGLKAGDVSEETAKRYSVVDPTATGESFREDKYFARQMDRWSDLEDGTRVKVGTLQTGSALNRVGLPASGMYFNVGKIKKAMGKHADHLTPAVLKEIPALLAQPVVITQYTGPNGTVKNTVNVYGNLFVGDKPIVVGVVMRLDSSGRNVINNVRTIHLRSDFAKQITDDSVLYLNENKKMTRKWFHDCGNLNVPLAGTQFGVIRSIAFEGDDVKPGERRHSVQPGEVNPDTGYEKGSIPDSLVRILKGDEALGRQVLEKIANDLTTMEKQAEQEKRRAATSAAFAPKGKLTETAVERNRKAIQALLDKYGEMPQTSAAQQPVHFPKKIDEDTKVRGFMQTAAAVSEANEAVLDEFERAIVEGDAGANYVPVKDATVLAKVKDELKQKSFHTVMTEWEGLVDNGRKALSKEDIAKGEQLLIEAMHNKDVASAMRLTADISAAATQAGQVVQAMTLLKKMSPTGKLYYVQRAVDRLNGQSNGKRPEITINEKLARNLLEAKSTEEIKTAMDGLIQDIADQVPVTWEDKWNAWRYLSMLGNPRTHVRNLMGNTVFLPARLVKDAVGTMVERVALPKEQRTKALFFSKELWAFAKQDAKEMRDVLSGGGKQNPSDMIRDKQRVFRFGILNRLQKANSDLLETEDWIFLRGSYQRSLASFLSARGYTVDQVSGPDSTPEGRAVLDQARTWAIREAQRATYRDLSALARALNNAKRNSPRYVRPFLEGVVPFTKTPINVVKRGIEYSPYGLAEGLINMATSVRKGDMTAAEALDKFCAGMTGTMIMTLGYFLTKNGWLIGDHDKDEEDKFDELQGEQAYSLRFGDTSYTVDWAAPTALPLFVGSEMYSVFQELKETKDIGWSQAFSVAADSMTSILEPILNLSMLDGLNKTLSANKNGDEDDSLYSIASTALTSYVTQGVPTILGQIARTIDDTRRTSFTPQGTGKVEGTALYTFQNSVLGKIPWASKKRMPYIDNWGRIDTEGSVTIRALENFISPGYINTVRTTPVEVELERLAGATKDSTVFPNRAEKSFALGDGTVHNMTQEEYQAHLLDRGQRSYRLVGDIINDSLYQELDDGTRAAAISLAYSYAANLAKIHTDPKYRESSRCPKWVSELEQAEKRGIDPAEYLMLRAESNLTEQNLTTVALGSKHLSAIDVANIAAMEYTVQKSFADPYRKGYEYKLNDKQIQKFEEVYLRILTEEYTLLTKDKAFQKATASDRYDMLSDVKRDVGDATRKEISDWLYYQGIDSTPKK